MRSSTIALLGSSLISAALGADILKTNGFTNCNNGDSTINVKNVDIQFDKSTNEITFDVAGSSEKEQEVTAELVVTAYGGASLPTVVRPLRRRHESRSIMSRYVSIFLHSHDRTDCIQSLLAISPPVALKKSPQSSRPRFPR